MTPNITPEEKLSILLLFADKDDKAIRDLKVKIEQQSRSQKYLTNNAGEVTIGGLGKNEKLNIAIQRPDGTYKSIGQINTGTKTREIKLISPTRALEAKTKITNGTPGNLHTQRPPQNKSAVIDGRNEKGKPTIAASSATGEKSGKQWVSRFMPSKSINDLRSPFRENVESFLLALKSAGASVTINTTLRPAQRSYLMYYARQIVTKAIAPDKVPEFVPKNGDAKVAIDWSHRDQSGKPNLNSALAAAKEMDSAYGAAGAIGKPYRSNHNGGKAVDMKISPNWAIGKAVAEKSGTKRLIKSKRDIVEVAATYGVLHWTFSGPRSKEDDPHWSETGN